jgi:NAD(P)H-nitrite reductase large subunit
MADDILICSCNELYRSAIVTAIKEMGLKTVKEDW